MADPPSSAISNENPPRSLRTYTGLGGCRFSKIVAEVVSPACRFAEFSSKWRNRFSHLCGGSENWTVVQDWLDFRGIGRTSRWSRRSTMLSPKPLPDWVTQSSSKIPTIPNNRTHLCRNYFRALIRDARHRRRPGSRLAMLPLAPSDETPFANRRPVPRVLRSDSVYRQRVPRVSYSCVGRLRSGAI
jgi:hypothetical protein